MRQVLVARDQNKFMTKTNLPSWEVCDTLGIFLAQGYRKSFSNINNIGV